MHYIHNFRFSYDLGVKQAADSLLYCFVVFVLSHGSCVLLRPSQLMHVSVLRYFQTALFSCSNEVLFIFISQNNVFVEK